MQHAQSIQQASSTPARSFATQWRRYDRMLEPFELNLMEAAALTGGEAVLDVGCGAGTTALDAARAVGPAGRVIGVDMDDDVLTVARARSAGRPNVRFIEADASSLEIDPVDAVVSRFGTLHFADPQAAFGHLRDCVRPGGRLVMAAWRAPAYNPWATVPLAALMTLVGKPAPAPVGGPFALADPARIEALLRSAGFVRPSLRAVDRPLYVGADVQDVLEFFFETDGRKLGRLLETVGYARATEALRAALLPYERDHGVWIPGGAWVVSAHRPA